MGLNKVSSANMYPQDSTGAEKVLFQIILVRGGSCFQYIRKTQRKLHRVIKAGRI